MSIIPEIAIGSIVAATIASLISLLGLIVSKEQKTSEFRQAWIDGLRSELAELVTHANGIHGAAMAGYETPKEIWEAAREHYMRLNMSTAHVRLRLNPSEAESQAVLNAINALESHLNSDCINIGELNDIEKNLVAVAQVLLKKEWRRVRSGEVTFRVAKWLAVILLASGALLLALQIINNSGRQSPKPTSTGSLQLQPN